MADYRRMAFVKDGSDAVTVLADDGAERMLEVRAVIARRTRTEVTLTADEGNSGDGNATLSDPSLGQLAEAGIYRLVRITAGATATFQVLSPKGYVLPDLAVGTAYEGGHLNLTVADIATDFVVGETFTVDVSGDGKVVALDPAAVDGSAGAIGIAAFDMIAPDGVDAEVTAILRDAILADAGDRLARRHRRDRSGGGNRRSHSVRGILIARATAESDL